ncbi:Fe-S cluster assembly protein SufD [Microbacteriaceae bacterium SG_E_30_P1]|uniref:Fe-S cluster assembly protein SufD n=1 Tax=Antiquaquibacter oligotrophicus TaxID=2880260 RepID=A0ABT6KLN5_9MICO|nr:Fe-S cluster assembly protein SufD [Antiquaquibacter oligotrophicus]MDH6180916.1 Fe-S cluster assembly protein SufD [Antiquaquibacter oligotrophicus]UDF13379.1 Fe-S cluster assembly protein SufD [Antiquaquibacter oligotrophicus]
MSIATTQTPGQHGATAHSDGGWGAGSVPVQTRSERFTSTDPADFPEVVGFEIDWKLTPVDRVRHLIDSPLNGEQYEIATDGADGTTVEWVAPGDARVGSAGVPEDKAAANAWSSVESVLSITVEGESSAPLGIDRTGLGTAPRAAHTVVTARPNSRGLVVLASSGEANLVENVEIVVGEGANLTVVHLQEWEDDALHLASHFAQVGRDAALTHIVITLGGSVVRVNPSVHLSGEGSHGDLFGLYFADGGQHFEQRVYLHHKAAHTVGRVNYKGALQGAGARTVWVGDVLIGPDATGTDSYEQNRNLVLTEGTRADSIPNLEIETGDILGAGHASATGRFDDEQLFYLQSRGITEPEARRLVVVGFLNEIIQKIGDDRLEEYVLGRVVSELGAGQ